MCDTSKQTLVRGALAVLHNIPTLPPRFVHTLEHTLEFNIQIPHNSSSLFLLTIPHYVLAAMSTTTSTTTSNFKSKKMQEPDQDFQMALAKMGTKALNAKHVEVKTRIVKETDQYKEYKATYDSLAALTDAAKTKMDRAKQAVKTARRHKIILANERNTRPKAFRKVTGRLLFVGDFMKNYANHANHHATSEAQAEEGKLKLDRSAVMTQANAAWKALSDGKKVRWETKAQTKNDARPQAAALAQAQEDLAQVLAQAQAALNAAAAAADLEADSSDSDIGEENGEPDSEIKMVEDIADIADSDDVWYTDNEDA